MTETLPKSKILLARLVIVLLFAFVILGVGLYGVSSEVLARIWQNMLDRPGGPFVFRFVLQPIMAVIAALRDGIQDARTGRTPFLWTVLADPTQRIGRLDEALIATSRIILLGLAMDAIYQFIEFKAFHPAETVIIALLLAFVPYVVLLMVLLLSRASGPCWCRRVCTYRVVQICAATSVRLSGSSQFVADIKLAQSNDRSRPRSIVRSCRFHASWFAQSAVEQLT